jgi:Icc-related predicted phosphoesterase
MRIIFFTDLHGSTLVFEKGLAVAVDYDVDLIILGGDLSGKRMLPIERLDSGDFIVAEPYKQKDDTGKAEIVYKERSIRGSELPTFYRKLEAKGYYWYMGDKEEIRQARASPAEMLKLEKAAITERLVHWAKLASDRMPEKVQCIWTGGNDDEQDVLNDFRNRDVGRFTYGEDQVHDFGGYKIISLGVSNRTPFETARERTESEICRMLEELARQLSDTEKLLLNVHVPPFNCGDLDLATDIQYPHYLVHVGSTAVRKFIEDWKPLADFAGHVHERKGATKIGRTWIFNPGSDYNSGILQALVVDLDGAGVRGYVHVLR